MSIAQSALNAFKSSKTTVDIKTIARRFNGVKITVTNEFSIAKSQYTFMDGSMLLTTGRGRNHKIWVEEAKK